ncbi:MAG: TPM domain-containing protein [Oscillospiraceae bacterium]|nr:TPM domain-containing protein [Oscillospiraceae bacterium]
MKKICLISVLFALFLLLPIGAFASVSSSSSTTVPATTAEAASEPKTALPVERFVLLDDAAALLNSAEKSRIKQQAADLAAAYGHDVVLLTTSDAGGRTAESYAERYIRKLRSGGHSLKDAFLFLIDMDNREPYVWWSGSAEAMYESRPVADAVFKSIRKDLTNGNYAGAFFSAIDTVSYYADSYSSVETPQQERPGGQSDDNTEYRTGYDNTEYDDAGYDDDAYPVAPDVPDSSLSTGQAVLSALVVGLAAALITVFTVNRKYKTVGVTGGLPYNIKKDLTLRNSQDILTGQNVTTRHIPKPPPPPSHGGGHSGGRGSGVASSGRHSGGSGHTGHKF